MRLFAILCWWDESPTWLAATVGSLARIGVDHVVAIDGKYPLFARTKPFASRPDQVEAIHLSAYASGMGVTIVQPNARDAMDEVEKRTLAFRLVETLGTPHEDWVTIIDADELIVQGEPSVKRELADLSADTHVMEFKLTSGMDHHAAPEADNDMTSASEAIAQVHVVPTAFTAWQTRCFRVLDQMSTGANHWMYNGFDRDGRRVYLRADTGGESVVPNDVIVAEPARPESCVVEVLHRKNARIRTRRESKVAYYAERDKLGIEHRALDRA